MDRGETPAVVMIDPKRIHNVAAVFRVCACQGVRQLWWTGARSMLDGRLPREERVRGSQSVRLFPNVTEEDVMRAFAKGSGIVPVGIEIVPGAETTFAFEHPEHAVYVLGPEDGSLPSSIRAWCHRFVAVPSKTCLNVGVAFAQVWYDRMIKEWMLGRLRGESIGDYLCDGRGFWDGDEPWAGAVDAR